jgi:DNA-binding beta-propeller fold protein YncE
MASSLSPLRVFAALFFVAAAAMQLHAAHAEDPPLIAGTPILVPGGPGGFDWMAVDSGKHRLLATHKGKGTLVVLDLNNEKNVQSIPVGEAQGIAVDEADGKYFVGDEGDKKLVVLDRDTLKKTAEIPVPGPVDAVALDPKRHIVYADHDNGTDVWLIDARTDRLVATIAVAGPPEYLEYDPKSDRLYQNIKTDDTVAVISPVDRKVSAVWKTTPATGPHGLAVDSAGGRVFSAGRNGKLSVLDVKTGTVVAAVDIAPGVDQIAFDSGNKRVYCGCRAAVSVVEATPTGARFVATV